MDLAFWLELALFIFLLLLSGFFSSSETSMFSLNHIHLEQMRKEGNPRITLIEKMLSEPRRLIVTILIGNEFVNVAASVLSAAMIIELMGEGNKLINIFVMVPILLIFGEITPKTLAIKNNIAFATVESGPINFFAKLIAPVRWAVRIVSEFFITLIIGKEISQGNIITEDMVRTLVQDAVGKGALDSSEAEYIHQIFEFGNKQLGEILTPRADITFLSYDDPLAKILSVLGETRQSRIPVFGEHRDDIVGILHVRDLLEIDLNNIEKNPGTLVKLLREPYFVPESKQALELFDTFKERKLSFALTVDEYGGVTGLVTMEDLLECIFGEIHSPSDITEQYEVTKIDDHFLIDGSMLLTDFAKEFQVNLQKGDVETIGGLILNEFGELPSEGDVITIKNFKFTIAGIIQNRVAELQMELLSVNETIANETTPPPSVSPEEKEL